MFLGIRVGHPFLQKVQALHASCVTVLQSSRQIYVSLLLLIEENAPQRLLNAHLLLSRPLNCILAKKQLVESRRTYPIVCSVCLLIYIDSKLEPCNDWNN